jgi:hypothetical protein
LRKDWFVLHSYVLMDNHYALDEPLGSVRPMRCNDPRKQALAWLIKRNSMAGD